MKNSHPFLDSTVRLAVLFMLINAIRGQSDAGSRVLIVLALLTAAFFVARFARDFARHLEDLRSERAQASSESDL